MSDEGDESKRTMIAQVAQESVPVSPQQQSLVRLMQELAEPWAEAEKAKHMEETRRQQEVTRRLEIETRSSMFATGMATIVLLGVLAIAMVALLHGAKELTEKLVIALLGITGGYIAGRGHAAMKKDT